MLHNWDAPSISLTEPKRSAGLVQGSLIRREIQKGDIGTKIGTKCIPKQSTASLATIFVFCILTVFDTFVSPTYWEQGYLSKITHYTYYIHYMSSTESINLTFVFFQAKGTIFIEKSEHWAYLHLCPKAGCQVCHIQSSQSSTELAKLHIEGMVGLQEGGL